MGLWRKAAQSLLWTLIVLFLGTGTVIGAQPQGGSGLLLVPTADLLQPGTLQVGGHWYDEEISISAAASLSRYVELGLSAGMGGDLTFVLRGKVRLLEETDFLPNMVIGIDFTGSDDFDVYAVMSKELGMPGFRVHGALGSGAYRTAMLGFSAVLNPVVVQRPGSWSLPVTTAVLEYDGNGINAGVKMRLSDHWAAHAALIDFRTVGASLQYRLRF